MCVASIVIVGVTGAAIVGAYIWAGWNEPEKPFRYVPTKFIFAASVWLIAAAFAVALRC